MKRSLPLLAVLAATTLASPVLAQDMSSFLNPRALAADLGLTSHSTVLVAPSHAYTLHAPVIVEAPERRSIVQGYAVAPHGMEDLVELMDEVADAAPAGANTAVILNHRPTPRPTWFQRLFGL